MNTTFATAIQMEKKNLSEIVKRINEIIDEPGYLNNESKEMTALETDFIEKVDLIFQLKNLSEQYGKQWIVNSISVEN